MIYKIIISRRAAKEIKKLPKVTIARVFSEIQSLAIDPRPKGVIKLTSFKNLWRVRVGNYRILYTIEDEVQIVDIRQVVDRKDAY